ncbi:Scr1 family TA system antitoxin-like transcriptional regulator [Streptomyces sp. NBC_00872]|uniref:Scr1 family TA system antitoxin-like transcriptional regulator n=1 Tax=Streptomyces sp. NBC_00872 TaxID=2903686 RepID=UPI00386EEF97
MAGGVGRELGDDHGDRVVERGAGRDAPVAELPRSEPARRLPPLSEEQFERQVAARLERQQLLAQRPNTSFSFLIEQAVLERQLGGPEVTSALIDNLLTHGRRHNVEILVMPLKQPDHSGIDGQMYLAETSANNWFGYVEGHESSMLIADSKVVSSMLQRYGKMRSQALSQEATAGLLKQIQGAL